MKNCRIILLTALLISALWGVLPRAGRAEAMDPVTIAVLAPVALKAARVASPYVIRAMQCMGGHFVAIGRDMVNIFRLPLGILECTFGIPFGLAGDGLQNLGAGAVAPFKLTLDFLLLPLSMFGVGAIN